MKILIPFKQVHDALTKGYGRIGAKTKTSLPVLASPWHNSRVVLPI